ncbi:rap guanine nucleotide exchange factor 1b isoform X14 [Brienomyrus brachyistius]|uniref:rap guanine nucleotide exchange factor 1b isoform X14 n=1 Tax=Brienomyrus brachyistius TaxID=42636 RepID=UPI0020B3EE7E|nr:rap guanine nucleotide exchange factor 1b isoform X14 [Brienomyrus brachyistius]
MGNITRRSQAGPGKTDFLVYGETEEEPDSNRSHLSSFTMKLMDKFHSPKIKRTPSKKGKQLQPEAAVKAAEKPANKKVSRLEENEKEVVSALRYFKTIVDKMVVDKKVLEMLPGSASKVLEAILPLVQVEPRIQHSSAVTSCLNRVYQSLANLIRWSDQVMLEGVNQEDKEAISTVTTVIKAVLDGVKELVKLTIEKQEQPSPASPVKPAPPVTASESTPELPLNDREKEILTKTAAVTQPIETLADDADEEVAPPKPPLPGLKVPDHSPPALPPKKRQSAPSPTRVAVVAPMSRTTSGTSLPVGINKQEYDIEYLQRRFSGGSHSFCGESPHLSPCSSMGKLSKSDEQLSSLEQDSGQCSRNTSCETLDNTESYDPDYDFLHQDLSNAEHLPALSAGGCLSPLPESHGESPPPGFPPQAPQLGFSVPPSPQLPLQGPGGGAPPALPQKKRRSTSQASGALDGSGIRASYERHPSHYDNISEEDLQPVPPFPLFTPGSPMPQSNGGGYLPEFISSETGDIPESPPPLPEKKSRHILQYMQFVEDYSEPQPSVFYQTPQNESIYEQRNKRFQEDPTGAVDDILQDPSTQEPPSNGKESLNSESRRQKSTDSGQSEEEVDELSLIDHKEIMYRITLKQENDDGPDVRAGSRDILLVHATETDRKDLVLYCEAFLTTYRTFITPEDLIKKLHYRYTRFCHSPDTFKKRVSKNTFFVLVRVVDELCLVELTDDILKQLMDLVFRLVCNGELSLARVLRKNILDKVEQKKQLRYTNCLKPLAARGVAARPGTLHDFRSHEIADQLTLLDAELFYKIEIPEVLLWAKEQNEEKSPNLTQFTEHFNNMSYWVRSIIIQQEKAQDREKLLLKFIKIMKHLRKLNNFNSYLAILSALDSAPIRRLEWQKQTSEGLEEYCTLIDSSSSFRAYRAALADVEPPCIPYLGLILQDLTFVHLGNPDLIEGKVNFSKRWQQFNILDSMRRFQQVHYDLKRNDDIVSFFNDFSDHLAEEALWELSLKIKPRNITRRKTEREEKT